MTKLTSFRVAMLAAACMLSVPAFAADPPPSDAVPIVNEPITAGELDRPVVCGTDASGRPIICKRPLSVLPRLPQGSVRDVVGPARP